jgi:hypothetical protein
MAEYARLLGGTLRAALTTSDFCHVCRRSFFFFFCVFHLSLVGLADTPVDEPY